MDQIVLKDFRCFHEEQTARLAPLTLLVGENSTGKTSFLAMVRALRELALTQRVPDFKQEPYDLGSFDEIAHYRGGKAGRADQFLGGFTRSERNHSASFIATFRKQGPAPVPVQLKAKNGPVWVEFNNLDVSPTEIHFGTSNGRWKRDRINFGFGSDDRYISHFPFEFDVRVNKEEWTPVAGFALPTEDDIHAARRLLQMVTSGAWLGRIQSFASAPVRSRPRRTYDPTRAAPDPEGNYIPMLYADLHFQNSAEWEELKRALESFGKAAGLFDEIVVRPLGKGGTEPFQLQIRKFGERVKGPRQNLIDVGYGVSQVLPMVTELLRSRRQTTHLLQQPEVHLHPSAQAALGSFFCQIAGPQRRRLIVETHSDYLLDRVRMDVRDGEGHLKPKDVSILYFERQDLDVKIHSLRLDKEGNVLEAPPGYGRFFMEEVSRSVRGRPRKSES